MSGERIRDAIAKVLRRIAPDVSLDDVGPEDNLQETLEIDSFDYLNLLIGLNEELGISVPESDYAKVATLGGLTRYFTARLEEA
ncbi:MAG TPA: acyl carrier protein [Vicinamibacteria bacterium]|jgi:acyl carrier protein